MWRGFDLSVQISSMRRREFLKNAVACQAGFLVLPGLARLASTTMPAGSPDPASFLHPPASSRPHTYWMWMNGNITQEGITLDLEAMQRGGIGGAYMYNNAVGIPRGPVDYGSEAWTEL